MKIQPLPVAGALSIVPDVFSDDRGYFKEVYAARRYAAAGIGETFVQDNLSRSGLGVLRGLHADPRMAKLVQVLRGEAFDVIVDIRAQSPTYRRWCAAHLRGEDHAQLYVPAGCLHGYLSLSEDVLFLYKQSALYDPATEFGIAWNDPELAIPWPLDGRIPRLSAKDAANPTLAERGL